MKKRFTDCDKWNDSWYMELSPEYKCFWQYIIDNCDNAGVWKVNKKLAEVQIGKKLNWEQLKKIFIERITFLNNEKWFINKFLKFQYGNNLKPSVKPQLNVIRLLEKHNLINLILIYKDNNYTILETLNEGLIKSYLTLKDKDKDKDKEKEEEKDTLKGGIVKGGNEIAKQVIDLFNRIYDKKCKYVESNLTYIRARLKEGYTLENFETVYRNKLKDTFFIKEPKYYRIKTLCGTNFDSYLNEIIRASPMTETGIKTYQAGQEFIKKQKEQDKKKEK